ncbi:MAG: arginase family protein [Pseudomonadota bacterium]
MADRWIVTPQYFESIELKLRDEAPADALVNGPHQISGRGEAEMAILHRPIAESVCAALEAGERPVSLAGDCCAAVPVLAGAERAGLTPQIVWIDAHGDFNTPETSPSQFLGGMPLAMIVGRGPQWMMEAVGANPADEAQVTLVDARDLDPLEAEAVAASDLRVISTETLATLRLDGPVMLHIDFDVLDASAAPAFNYPVKGGPDAATLAAALEGFAEGNDIRALSFSAWTPSLDTDGATARACRTAMAPLFR